MQSSGARANASEINVDEYWVRTGDGMQHSPEAQSDVRRYVENIAAWLAARRA
jgi:hypothetical protein